MGKFFKRTVTFRLYILMYIVLILFNTSKAKAQHNFFYKEDFYSISNSNQEDNTQNPMQEFPSCKSLFTDTVNKHNVKFKKVIEYDYSSKDTSLKHKKLLKTTTTFFNTNGYAEYRVVVDSDGIDTTKYYYDKHLNGIGQEYISQIQTEGKSILIRDKKDRVLKDSSTFYFGFGNKTPISYSVINNTYDNSGNCIKYIRFYTTWGRAGTDTAIVIKQYDNKNRIIAEGSSYSDIHTSGSSFYKYDDNSNIIDYIQGDSTRGLGITCRITKVFDARNGVIFEKKFDYYRGTHKTSITYNTDGGRTDTTEFIGRKDFTDPNSCTIASKTVTVYNKFGDVVSETITSLTEGKTSTSASTHKSQYNADGKLLCDSETTITESQMSYGRTLSVMTFRYDAKGNKIESNYSGMDEKWVYKYNEKNKLVEEDRYDGSCSDKPNLRHQIVYYPDGVTVKEDISDNISDSRIIKKYGKDTEQTEWTCISPGNTYQIITEYFQ